MSIEKEPFKPLEEQNEPITEREKEIKEGALPSVLEAAEIRRKEWMEKPEEEIRTDIETEQEINEELRKEEIPAKRSQIKEARGARQEMVRLEAEYDKYKFWTGDISKHFKKEDKIKAKKDYEQAKDKYNEVQNELLGFYLEKAQDRWNGEEGKVKFKEFRDEIIFRRAFGREQERISQAKQETLSEQDKGRFREILGKIGQEFNKIPKGRRWVYTALLGTGAALGMGAIAAPAALGYAGFRFSRAAFASFSALGIKKVGDNLEKNWLKEHGKEKREEKVKESLVEQMGQINDFEQMNKLLMEKREERDEELAKLAKAQKYWQVGKVAAMIGAGGGIAFCAGHFDIFGPDDASTGVHEQLEIEEGRGIIRMPMPKEEVATGPAAEELETGIRVRPLKETIEEARELEPKIKEEAGERMLREVKTKPLGESLEEARELEPKVKAEAEERILRATKTKPLRETVEETRELEAKTAAIPPEVAKVEAFEIAEKVDIKRGDSIWSVAEKYLKGNKVYRGLIEIGDKNTVEALETYNIDRVKDIIVADPQLYGLPEGVDLDKLTISQLKGINWEKAFTDTFPEGKGLTDGLTQEQIDSIVENNKTLRTFFQEHPNAPRASENYEAILKGKGITGEVAEAEVITPEEAVSEKELSPDEKRDLLKKAGVSSEDIGKLKTEDIKDLTPEQIKDITEVQEKIDSLKKSGVSSEDIGKLKTEDIKDLTPEQIKDIAEVKEKVDLLKKAGVSPEDIGKLKTEDIKDLTSSQIKEMADKAKEELLPVAEDQLNKARINLMDAYGMSQGESEAILDEKIGNLLENTPEKLAEAGDRFGPGLKLKHDGLFSFGEYKKYCEMANDVRAVGPKPEEMDMTVGEFFTKKLSPEFEGAKEEAVNIELKEK